MENLHFMDSINYLPVSVKSIHNSFDLTRKKGTIPNSSTRPTIWITWVLIPNPSSMRQSISGDERAEFSPWYEGVKDKIVNNREAYCMDDVNVLRQACCTFRKFFLKLVKMDPFRQAILISCICNKVFRTMLLKPDSVGITPRGGYLIGVRQSVEALQWLPYIGRTCNNLTDADNRREVHLPGVRNEKFDGHSQDTRL